MANARTPSVLLVEDDDAVRLTLERYLGAAGYEVIPTSDPDTAFEAFTRTGVDAVIVDIRLAGNRSGLEVLQFVRLADAAPELLTIVLTGVALSEDEEEIVRRCSAYVFYKPQGYREIVELLDTRLRA